MSNISKVISFIQADPNFDKAAMTTKIVNELGVTKSNAQVYIYNALKKMNGATPVRVKKEKVAKEPVEGKRAAKRRLTAEQKAAAKRFSDYHNQKLTEQMDADRPIMEAEIEEYVNEAEQYLRENLPIYARKELGLI